MDRLKMSEVKISKIMTRNLITVFHGSTVEEAVKKMVEHDVECLPVIDAEGILQGLITFRDIVTKVLYFSVTMKRVRVGEIMSRHMVTCSPDSTVLDVAKIMKNKHLRRIPVINKEKVLVGLVTNSDLALFGWDFK